MMKCFHASVRALHLYFTAVTFTCIAALLRLSLRYFVHLLLVQIFPLLFGMTQAEHKAMELGVKMRQVKKKKGGHTSHLIS